MKNRQLIFFLSFITLIVALIMIQPVIFGFTKGEKKELEEKFYLSDNKTFSEQLLYRESIIAEYNKNLLSYYKNINDSLLFENPYRNKSDILFLLPRKERYFRIHTDNHTLRAYWGTGIDSLNVTLSINFDKINIFLDEDKPTPLEFVNVLKYQDVIKYKTSTVKHLRVSAMIIMLGVMVFLFFLISFLSRESLRNNERKSSLSKERLEIFEKELKSDIDYIENAINKSADINELGDVKRDMIFYLNKYFTEINDIKNNNKGLFIIQSNVDAAFSKSKSVSRRSVLMLISGLIMAFIGMTVFYFSLPKEITPNMSFGAILSLSLRPTMILIFIEAIAWYLLRQYRLLIKDDNYFYSLYDRKQNLLTAYKLIDEIKEVDLEKKYLIPLTLLAENGPKGENEKDAQEVNDRNLLITLVEKLFPK